MLPLVSFEYNTAEVVGRDGKGNIEDRIRGAASLRWFRFRRLSICVFAARVGTR